MTTGLNRFAPQFLGLLRIATALTFMEHGTQKLFHFPAMGGMGGGPGGRAASAAVQQGADAASSALSSAVDTASSALSSAIDTASSMLSSAPPPTGGPSGMAPLFLIAGILEFFGGLALVLGILTRPIAFILAGECAVIFWWMHVMGMGKGQVIPLLNGGEAAVLYCFTFLYLVFAGPGAFAVDGLFGRKAAV